MLQIEGTIKMRAGGNGKGEYFKAFQIADSKAINTK